MNINNSNLYFGFSNGDIGKIKNGKTEILYNYIDKTFQEIENTERR